MNNNNFSRAERKKKRRLKKRYKLLIPLLIIVLAIGVYAAFLIFKTNDAINKSHEGLNRDGSSLRDSLVKPGTDNVSLLLMGIDSSDTRGSDEIARTDALIVATFNVKEKNVKMVTIPRDSLVYIPFLNSEDKINHAHARASKDGMGPTATVETVEHLLNIPIDYYMRLNFEAFIDVVEALDGIDVEVPYELKEQNSLDSAGAIHLLPGMQRLNGEEALALARTRKKDSDFMRGLRQQDIIKAIATRAVSLSSVFKYGEVIDAIGDNMKSNMKPEEVRGFSSYLLNTQGLDIESLSIDGDDSPRPWKPYYWILDDDSVKRTSNILQRHLGITETDYGLDPVVEE